MLTITQLAPTVLSAFLASLVEFVEALTIVLAVGTVRGWPSALAGAFGAALILGLLVLAFGPLLGSIPIAPMQIVVGLLLLLFGMRWLRKAILRASNFIPLHDEAAAFAKESSALRSTETTRSRGYDPVAVLTAFKAVLLEGIEVVFIVIAVGATGQLLIPATIGAVAAGLLVIGLGVVLHRPLARVPENTLKFAVGIMLSAFGIFWVGEGLGLTWPGADLSLPVIALALLATALVLTGALRRPPTVGKAGQRP